MDAETSPPRSITGPLRGALRLAHGAWSQAARLALDIALPTLCVACREPVDGEGVLLIEKWIRRGAKTTEEECPPADSPNAKKSRCNDRPLRSGTYQWQKEPPLETPESQGELGFQMYTPPRPVDPGTEWETCYAFKNIDWL